jgi:hypothetical protein
VTAIIRLPSSVAGQVGDRRTEEDFVRHVERTVATDPQASWVFVTEQLNIHLSEGLVRLVALLCGIDERTLGQKGKRGVLKSLASRKAFLSEAGQRVRFVYTPKHSWWLNQVEIWFSIRARRVPRRGNFSSKEDLRTKILAFIDYCNDVLAKPFRWTFTGQVLKV